MTDNRTEPTTEVPWPAVDDLLQALGITVNLPEPDNERWLDMTVTMNGEGINALQWALEDYTVDPSLYSHFWKELERWEQQLSE